jgi:hypothetical protein
MPHVRLGNVAPTTFHKKDPKADAGDKKPVKIDNGFDHDNAVTEFGVPPGTPIGEALTTIAHVWWRNHSSDPPEWVECPDDAALEVVLAATFTWADGHEIAMPDGELVSFDAHECVIGKPKGWEGLDPAVLPDGDDKKGGKA